MPRRFAARHDRFPLHTPFRISRGVKTAADVVTVTVAQDGAVGWGEGVPYPRNGESVDVALADLAAVRALVEGGGSRAEVAAAMAPGAARGALDAALWDLEAQLASTGVAALAGWPEPVPVASAITVVIDTPDAMARAAAAHADVPLLKIKVDRDGAAAQIAAVRAAAPRPRLIVDPNESWRIDDVVAHAALLVEHRVDLLEQPLPAGEDGALAGITAAVPVCADESLHTRNDLAGLRGRYTHVNVKLDKSGGLTEALALAEAATAAGFGLMVGCMVGSSLAIAPALVLAGQAEFVDLDGPLWLSDDRPGGVVDRRGVLHPPAAGFWGAGRGGPRIAGPDRTT